MALIVFIAVSCLSPQSCLANYSAIYELLNHFGESGQCRLNVMISESLHQYYVEKNHGLFSNSDFAKFVTPYALRPLADSLWEIYLDDEDFANGALMIVHQIPYEESTPPEYPVETIVNNKGDCDLLSYVAASIMKAGGLDVVLLYYEREAHMNIGVSLSHVPQDTNKQADYVLHEGVKFYVAECTGENWQNGWRVGECPESLGNASVQVITLENCEKIAPGQVSAGYSTLRESTITLSLSAGYIIQGSRITLSGELSPPLENETITVYARVNGLPWTTLDSVTTDSLGRFIYLWNVRASGTAYVRASWSGNDYYAAADSSAQTLMSFSISFVLLAIIATILTIVGTAIFLTLRRSQAGICEPRSP